MNTRTREITEGAMVVAIMGVFLLIDKYLANMLQGYLFFLMPLPTLIYAAKYGFKKSVITVLCVILTCFIIANESLLQVIIYSVLGHVYGSGINSKKSNNWLIASAFVICLIEYILTMIVLPRIYGQDMYLEFDYLAEMFSQYNPQLESDLVRNIIHKLFPVILILSALMEVIIVHIIAHLLLPRLRIEVPPLKGLLYIRVPAWAGFLLFTLWILGTMNGSFGWFPDLVETGYAIASVCQLILSFFGYIVMVMVSKLTGQKMLLYIALASMFLFNWLLFILGCIDCLSPTFREQLLERYPLQDDKNPRE